MLISGGLLVVAIAAILAAFFLTRGGNERAQGTVESTVESAVEGTGGRAVERGAERAIERGGERQIERTGASAQAQLSAAAGGGSGTTQQLAPTTEEVAVVPAALSTAQSEPAAQRPESEEETLAALRRQIGSLTEQYGAVQRRSREIEIRLAQLTALVEQHERTTNDAD